MDRKYWPEGLTDGQIAKIEACKSLDELRQLAKEEGIEFTEEQLEAASEGMIARIPECPRCKKGQVKHLGYWVDCHHYECQDCGWKWFE